MDVTDFSKQKQPYGSLMFALVPNPRCAWRFAGVGMSVRMIAVGIIIGENRL